MREITLLGVGRVRHSRSGSQRSAFEHFDVKKPHGCSWPLLGGAGLGRRLQTSEEAVSLGQRAGGEKEGVCASRPAAIAEGQSPNMFDLDGPVVDVFEQAVESSIKPE